MVESSRPLRMAACLTCRRSKIKCEKEVYDSERCRRCSQLGAECVRPAFSVGRKKGVKNKRRGLDKVVGQVEDALRRIRSDPANAADARKMILHLQDILGRGVIVAERPEELNTGSTQHSDTTMTQQRASVSGSQVTTPDSEAPDSSSEEGDGDGDKDMESRGEWTGRCETMEEGLAVDDAENPLQLLARASNLHQAAQPAGDKPSARPSTTTTQQQSADHGVEEAAVQDYFAYSQFSLDVGEDIDPLHLGLVCHEEAESLFAFFHQRLSHTRWGIDPVLYTVPFTRTRSAFLLTSILAAAALYQPGAAALSKRLSNHARALADRVIRRRHRSVEIVLAFLVSVPWMFPAAHSADDDTSFYIAMASHMAIDLSLHKMLQPAGSGECIDPSSALRAGGFVDVDPQSDYGQRLLRSRERCWIALFVLERGMCLARGRTSTVPVTRLIRSCDNWHASDATNPNDGHLISVAVLRRDLDGLFHNIRALCDASVRRPTDGRVVAESIQQEINAFFDQWLVQWRTAIGSGTTQKRRLPPYVDILVAHTRLSVYTTVINHPTAPVAVRHVFRTAGLSAALNVMRAAIQGEAQLSSMPNNTAIMISFAACFALRLSAQVVGSTAVGSGSSQEMSASAARGLVPSVRTLVEETAGVLERIGYITSHRNGMSTLYGMYLRILVRKAGDAAACTATAGFTASANTSRPTNVPSREASTMGGMVVHPAPMTPAVVVGSEGLASSFGHLKQQVAGPATAATPDLLTGSASVPSSASYLSPTTATTARRASTAAVATWPEPFVFSAMSDDQIVQALQQAGSEFASGPDPSFLFADGASASAGSDPGTGHGTGTSTGADTGDDSMSWITWSNLPDFAF